MSHPIQIERSVPLTTKGITQFSRYPFSQMKVGDSFFLNKIPGKPLATLRNALRQAALLFCKHNCLNWEFSTRTTINGVRIWRTK